MLIVIHVGFAETLLYLEAGWYTSVIGMIWTCVERRELKHDDTTSKNLNKLQSVKNFACRIVSGARKYDHVTPILKDLNWLPVTTQLYYRSATMAFKCMTGRVPTYISSQFIKRQDVSNRNTRNSQQLNIPLFKTATGQRTFYTIRLLAYGTLWMPH